ncbi:MAG: HigA family addiction module antitoxin [Mariprofundaceae bacterium]|nr:HigA family addiction module antitoxin [Mariprofundaceae bacterium]
MTMLNPSHIGEILRYDVLEPLGISMTDAASKLGISRKTLSKVCNGNGAVTPEIAVRLELALGKPSATHWLKLQTAYDLAQANQKRDALHEQVQPLTVA